jgi:Bacterial regulatory proteins, luxR family.
MNGESAMRSGHVDLWLSDNYLRCGLESILQNIHFGDSQQRYVFLTEQQYFDVINQHYDLTKNKIIMLTDGNTFNFLGTSSMYQLSMKTTANDLQKFITTISNPKNTSAKSECQFSLTARERRLIDLIKEGKKMAEMGEHLNVHIKTVYQIRQTLIKKMGCDGVIDFLRTLRSDVFRNWLCETHQYH